MNARRAASCSLRRDALLLLVQSLAASTQPRIATANVPKSARRQKTGVGISVKRNELNAANLKSVTFTNKYNIA